MIQKTRLVSNFSIAVESVASNKIRSFLTALGIIFGVAAVITMLAIGKGAEKEIMDQMELVGVNNILITSFTKQEEGDLESESEEGATSDKVGNQLELSPGLTLADAENIESRVPGINIVSPEIIIDARIIKDGMWRTTQLIGVNNNFFDVYDFDLSYGRKFSDEQLIKGLPVCIIGEEIRRKFINEVNPIGVKVKLKDQWLVVVGVLEAREVSEQAQKQTDLGIRDYSMDVYIPVQTMLLRYENRSLITSNLVAQKQNPAAEKLNINYHQLDRLIVKVKPEYDLSQVSLLISKILKRRHMELIDYKITIPELLLKQQQQAKKVFSIVLAVIAGISLLVGGIGIMNIMLASVLERIKEIGLRIAMGAKQTDIVQQFLFEAIIIGISGGIVGVVLGIMFSLITRSTTGISTIVSPFSILLSFVVAVSIGLIFGIAPAKRAAKQNPINSLRHE